jgi:predicted metal-dependent hydrolase
MDQPLIIGFISDLMFATRIEQAASLQGFRLRWIEGVETIDPQALPQPDRQQKISFQQAGEALSGTQVHLMEILTREHPALLIFDLGNTQVPWRTWLPLLKSDPATRRVPVVCYGAHVDKTSLVRAQRSGADAVLARSKFAASLPEILAKYARIPDNTPLEAACQVQLSPLAVRGLEEFNRGEYFKAHETLEEAWNADDSAARELYRAILQVAVAYLQIERGNYPGAMKMFWRLRQWIDPLPAVCRGVNVEQLRQDADRVYTALKSAGAEGISNFDRGLFKPVIFHLMESRGDVSRAVEG